MNHIDYCNNRMARQNASCHVEPGEKPIYSLDGKIYTEGEFEKAFPIITIKLRPGYDKRYMKGENSDTTKNWMNS